MSKWLNNTYLGKLFHLDRKLSFWVAGFFFLSVCCSLFKLEVTPFFVWGMYSEVEIPQSTYQVSRIKVNDTSELKMYTGANDNVRFFLSSPLQYYKDLQINENTDIGLTILRKKFPTSDFPNDKRFAIHFDKSGEAILFGSWYAKYIGALTQQDVKSLTGELMFARFSSDRKIIIDSSHVFFQWP